MIGVEVHDASMADPDDLTAVSRAVTRAEPTDRPEIEPITGQGPTAAVLGARSASVVVTSTGTRAERLKWCLGRRSGPDGS